jgi:hypothetical protein
VGGEGAACIHQATQHQKEATDKVEADRSGPSVIDLIKRLYEFVMLYAVYHTDIKLVSRLGRQGRNMVQGRFT